MAQGNPEVSSQVGICEPEKVTLAPESGLLRKDREGKDFAGR